MSLLLYSFIAFIATALKLNKKSYRKRRDISSPDTLTRYITRFRVELKSLKEEKRVQKVNVPRGTKRNKKKTGQ